MVFTVDGNILLMIYLAPTLHSSVYLKISPSSVRGAICWLNEKFPTFIRELIAHSLSILAALATNFAKGVKTNSYAPRTRHDDPSAQARTNLRISNPH